MYVKSSVPRKFLKTVNLLKMHDTQLINLMTKEGSNPGLYVSCCVYCSTGLFEKLYRILIISLISTILAEKI